MTQSFFKYLIENEVHVTIYLVCGVKLQGVLISENEKGFLVKRDLQTQFIYHHAISTVTAGRNIPEMTEA